MMESRGQKFSLVQEIVDNNLKLKLQNSNNEEMMSVVPKIPIGKNRKMIMVNNEKKTLYSVSLKNPSSFILEIQKENKKEVLATLHTKVLDGNKFKLSIVDKEKERYGSERFIEFSKDGSSFTITCEQRIVCEFHSNKGPVGTSGGKFRIASKEYRNFNLSVVSLVIIMQVDALKEGGHSKGVGIWFKDTGQIPESFLMKSSKGRDSSEMLASPSSDTIGSEKNSRSRHSSVSPPVSPRKEPRKSRSSAVSPEKPKRKQSKTEKDTSPPEKDTSPPEKDTSPPEKDTSPREKDISKKKGKNKKVAKNTEKPHSPLTLSPSEGLEKSPITIPGGDSYVKCWDELEAIVAQSNRNQT